MTADPHHTQQGPGRPLYASLAASDPVAGASRRPDPGSGPQNATEGREALRERIAAVLSTLTVLGGTPPARLVPVIRWGAGEVTRIVDWRPLEGLLDHLEGAVDAALDIGEEQAWCKTCRRVWDGPRHRCETDAEQRISRIREKAVEWAALAPADDWGDTPQDTALADVGRYLLSLIEKPLKEQP